jgi:actin-related protein 6
MTISSFTPQPVKRELYDVLFSDFRFHRVALIDTTIATQFSPQITSQFTPQDWANPCGLLVDVGFSFVNIIPVFNTQAIVKASQRVPVAGRILNNLLRERLAYLQVDLDDNPLLVQHIKESAFQISQSRSELNEMLAQKSIDTIGYILPDFSSSSPASLGSVVGRQEDVPPGCQAIKIGPDRFVIPEAIFSPGIFGIDEIGIVDAIKRAISLCDVCIQKCVSEKIILSGGSAMMAGFVERLSTELESCGIPPRLLREPDGRYDLSAWRGASQIATNEDDLAFLGAMYRHDWQSP